MKNSTGFKLEYTWDDLRPVHPLFFTVLIAQAIGAAANLYLQGPSNWFDTAWIGGALGTLPGFLVGILVQAHMRPGSITAHRSMVLLMGFVALLLFLAALFLPPVSSSAA